MNTKKIGDQFEDRVFNYFQSEINNGRFIATADRVKIYKQKRYYSAVREDNIAFYVVIEIYRPGATSASILYIIECKNYKSPIGVGKLEEFYSKVNQVCPAGAKLVFVSSSPFQSGAVSFAKNSGMALVRMFPSGPFKWELERSPSSLSQWVPPQDEQRDIKQALMDPEFTSYSFEYFCVIGRKSSNNPTALLWLLAQGKQESKLLKKPLNPENPTEHLVPYASSEDIESAVSLVLRNSNHTGGFVDLRQLCEVERQTSDLELHLTRPRTEDETHRGVLGKICFDPLEITVFESDISNAFRRRFTLAHELGHLFMGHGRALVRESVDDGDLPGGRTASQLPHFVRRMEFQANRFAAGLLLPKTEFTRDAISLALSIGLKDIGHGLIYVDDQKCNLKSFYQITDQLVTKYKVSRQTVAIRLKDLELLTDARGKKWARSTATLNHHLK